MHADGKPETKRPQTSRDEPSKGAALERQRHGLEHGPHEARERIGQQERKGRLIGIVQVSPQNGRIFQPVSPRLANSGSRVKDHEKRLKEANYTARDLVDWRLGGLTFRFAKREPRVDAEAGASRAQANGEHNDWRDAVHGEGSEAVR